MAAGTTRVPRPIGSPTRRASLIDRRSKASSHVTSADTASVRRRSNVFIEVAAAHPRRSPTTNSRVGVSGPRINTTTAKHQKTIHKLSVRYSSDLRKNGGKRLSSSAAHKPTAEE